MVDVELAAQEANLSELTIYQLIEFGRAPLRRRRGQACARLSQASSAMTLQPDFRIIKTEWY